jgi:hypothetical protein
MSSFLSSFTDRFSTLPHSQTGKQIMDSSSLTKRDRTTSSFSSLSAPTQQPPPAASFESLPEVLHSTIAPYLKQHEEICPDIGLVHLIATARWVGQHYDSCITSLSSSNCQKYPALLRLLMRLPALETLKLLSSDNNESTTVVTALRAGACSSLTTLEVCVKSATKKGVKEILRALGTGSCPSLHRLTLSGLDMQTVDFYPYLKHLGEAEAEEIALALAEALEARQEIGCAGLTCLEAPDIWLGRHLEASSCIIPLVTPTIEVGTLWCYDVFTDFSDTVEQHPGPLPLKELSCQPDAGDEHFDFLPLARAMKEGKFPHLESLHIEFVSLGGQAVGCLIDALEGGSLKMLEALDMRQVSLGDDGYARLFQALGNAAQHTQHVARLSFEADDEIQDVLGTQAIQALGWALQHCGACPNLKHLFLGEWHLGGADNVGMAALLGTSLATPRPYKELGIVHICSGSLTSDSMKVLAQFMSSGGFPALRELRLYGDSGIGTAGLQHLVTGLKSCHSLDRLNISDCCIADAGLRCLAQACAEGSLNSLREVNFRRIAWSDEVKEECRQSMKEHGVTVTFD